MGLKIPLVEYTAKFTDRASIDRSQTVQAGGFNAAGIDRKTYTVS
jgi:hypothetical protein